MALTSGDARDAETLTRAAERLLKTMEEAERLFPAPPPGDSTDTAARRDALREKLARLARNDGGQG